ncbi:hypothetical protein H0A65_10885 [Alcaligenaceae bacterium]|nr:hypothetical protein [Alcaligenaceae bacterium]
MTDEQYRRWLRNDMARRTVLLEIDTDPVRRLSVVPYTTLPDDDTPNIRYDALIKGGVGYDETLSIDDNSRASYANIDLHNEDGALDAWAGDVWQNREIRVYFGDVTWARDDYRLVAQGVVERCEQSRDTFSIHLIDAMARLDNAVTETLLGGAGRDADRLMPVALGECHNVAPRLYANGTHTYRWHGGTVERLIEVRDRGVPVSYTASGGQFSLLVDPDGEITASVQGDADGGYVNTVSALVQRLATAYGPAASRFTSDDLDAVNLSAFNSAHPQPVGLYLLDHATVQACIVELASSLGAQAIMSRIGKLRLLRVELPAPGVPVVIQPSDYEQGSLEIAGLSTVIAGVRLGYCRQWTPRQNIAEGIPTEHRDLYAQEWLTVTATAPSVASEYKISTETEQVNTLLLTKTDAQAEATRRLALWSVPRTIVTVRGYAHLLDLELGQPATVYGSRFGLDAGKTGQIVGLKPDWVAGRCDVEVLL